MIRQLAEVYTELNMIYIGFFVCFRLPRRNAMETGVFSWLIFNTFIHIISSCLREQINTNPKGNLLFLMKLFKFIFKCVVKFFLIFFIHTPNNFHIHGKPENLKCIFEMR